VSGQRLPWRIRGVEFDIAVATGYAGTLGLVQESPLAWVLARRIAAALVIADLPGPALWSARLAGSTGARTHTRGAVNTSRSRPVAPVFGLRVGPWSGIRLVA
jgi:hypothetical protein